MRRSELHHSHLKAGAAASDLKVCLALPSSPPPPPPPLTSLTGVAAQGFGGRGSCPAWQLNASLSAYMKPSVSNIAARLHRSSGSLEPLQMRPSLAACNGPSCGDDPLTPTPLIEHSRRNYWRGVSMLTTAQVNGAVSLECSTSWPSWFFHCSSPDFFFFRFMFFIYFVSYELNSAEL